MGRFVEALDRFNRAHPWSHNDFYASWVLRQAERTLRNGGATALDVGCGSGNLLRRLSEKFPRVVGVEADPTMAAQARAATHDLPNVHVVNEAFSVDDPAYDFVSMVAVMHHLPLAEGINAARAAVAPGGGLAIVGLSREEDRVDRALSLLSLILNPVIGLIRHPRHVKAELTAMTAPTTPPTYSYAEIRTALREQLPGVRVRRALFWRYTAVWHAPL